jgi:YHS domain-containing protein
MKHLLCNAARKAAWIALIPFFWPTGVMAFDAVNTNVFGVAIKGYDTVAYHTENRAVKGKSQFSHKWNDAKWYFASAENRDLFAADPERYAPQYGGY